MTAEQNALPVIDVPITVSWAGTYWRLDYLRPCQFCHQKHSHGGNDDPAGPNLGEDVWGSHCPSEHRSPFGPDCDAKRVAGRLWCVAGHRHMVRLHEATNIEGDLTPEKAT